MTARLFSAAITALALAYLIVGPARAQDGGGFDPCAGLKGAAFGLCKAYNEHMGCSSATPQAAQAACDNVAQAFEQNTGFPPPSDCPCDFSPDRIRDSVQGWDLNVDFFCEVDETLTPGSISTQLFNDDFAEFSEGAAVDLSTGTFGCVYQRITTEKDIVVLDTTADSLTLEELGHLYQACKGAVVGLADSINVTCVPVE